MPKNKMTCPICGRTLTENDKLVLTLDPMRGYWVTWHYYKGDVQPNGDLRSTKIVSFKDHTGKYYNWCAQAAIQTVIPV